MALELMCNEMVRQVKLQGATQEQTAAYLSAWQFAVNHSGEPLPCPLCYMQGQIARLKPISEDDETASVRCARCHTEFEFASQSK